MDEKQFLIEKVLPAKADLNSREVTDVLALLRHDTVNMPVVYIGSGTCGKVAGANETLNAVHKYLEEKNIKAFICQKSEYLSVIAGKTSVQLSIVQKLLRQPAIMMAWHSA